MAVATRLPVNASVYELIRTGHGSIKCLTKGGLSLDDLDLRVREAAHRTGLPIDMLTGLHRPARPERDRSTEW